MKKKAIEKWFDDHDTSPNTGLALNNKISDSA